MEPTNPYQTPSADLDHTPGFDGNDETSVFSPKGRFGRLSYLAWYMVVSLAFVLVAVVIALLGGFFAQAGPPADLPVVALLLLVPLGLFVAYILIVFAIRRLHDMNLSGWWLLLFLIPIVNVIPGLVLILGPGSDGGNNFGPMRITLPWEKVLGIISLLLSVANFIAMFVTAIPAYQQYVEMARQAAGG